MIQSKIIISRASAVSACAKKYKIELDGIVVAELGNGKTVEITVNEGSHTLSFIAFGKCENCIFNIAICLESESKYSWIHNKDFYSDKFLNQEIEVE